MQWWEINQLEEFARQINAPDEDPDDADFDDDPEAADAMFRRNTT